MTDQNFAPDTNMAQYFLNPEVEVKIGFITFKTNQKASTDKNKYQWSDKSTGWNNWPADPRYKHHYQRQN
ncbi:hypothetical protein STBHUCCB_45160 [Salmonella enterica subsp. enterica serovar Typhi str. P-stx-12]|nr:hypothetical protein STBHUCCB_45160 [Salmonella enterica subsp. enterica serovar Typhi str. P-stx-12]